MLKEVVNNGNLGSLQIIDCNRIRQWLTGYLNWWSGG